MSFARLVETLKQNYGGLLAPFVNRHLLERNTAPQEIETWFHPSSAAPSEDLCARALFYQLYTPFKAYPKELLDREHGAQTHRIFDNGTWLHRRWQMYFIEMGICDPRVRIGWEIPILDHWRRLMGHADAVVYLEAYQKNRVRIQRAGLANGDIPVINRAGGFEYEYQVDGKWIDGRKFEVPVEAKPGVWAWKQIEPSPWKLCGKPTLVDMKSINDWQYNELAVPMPKHLSQITHYFGWLKENQHPDLEEVHWIYENKNTQAVKEFHQFGDLNLWALYKQAYETVARAKEANKNLPERICTNGICHRARECSFGEICFTTKTCKDLQNWVPINAILQSPKTKKARTQ